MPVVTPSAASIETVNAVLKADSFLAAIRSRPSSSQRSAVKERQINPRPWVAMKLIASGVANCAAIVRSPSFSRFSSSQTTTIRPRRTSSMASSMVEKGPAASASAGVVADSGLCIVPPKALHEPFRVARDQVDLEVHGIPFGEVPQGRAVEGLRDQRDLEPVVSEPRHREADAVDGDRAVLDDVAAELGGQGHLESAREPVLVRCDHVAGAVDVTLDEVPAQWLAGLQRGLQVDRSTRLEVAEGGQRQRLVHDVRLEPLI